MANVPRIKSGAVSPDELKNIKAGRIRVPGFRGSYQNVRFDDDGRSNVEVDENWVAQTFGVDFPSVVVEFEVAEAKAAAEEASVTA